MTASVATLHTLTLTRTPTPTLTLTLTRRSPAAVDERPPPTRSPPTAQSPPRLSAHEQPHARPAPLACRASPNRRRPARVRRRSSERVGESSAAARGASPPGGSHEMETYLRSLSDQARATRAKAPLGPVEL